MLTSFASSFYFENKQTDKQNKNKTHTKKIGITGRCIRICNYNVLVIGTMGRVPGSGVGLRRKPLYPLLGLVRIDKIDGST